MSLVEREKELDFLDGVFAAALSGAGQLVVTDGPVGSGKSTLLHAFAGRVAASGATVLAAAGARTERQPLGLVQQLLDHAAAIDAAGGCGEVQSAVEAANAPAEITAGKLLVPLVRTLARRGPLLVAIDDVDNADPASLRCLLYLIRRISPERVMVVLNESADPAVRQWDFHAELRRLPQCRSLRLGLLSTRGVGLLLSQRLGPAISDQLTTICHNLTGGNPLLMLGAIDDYRLVDDSARLEVGEGFRRALISCLYRWEPAIHQVALALAVLGSATCPIDIGRLLDMPTHVVLRGITALTAAGLLQGNGFRHPVARSAVLADVHIDDHAELHERASAVLVDVLASAEPSEPSEPSEPFGRRTDLYVLRVPGHAPAPAEPTEDMLSDAELRVARLAAAGHTNREIARRLFVTVSTVEQHLTRVYRKLNVHQRADLPADLAVTA